ncbi:uL22m family ribosomal protein [Pseudonocardia endophytica]|uniref:50S ribosomal protein L22 n=1 Tax=Pseudonocardia endophytica TaxID=401976 RepID=A0A4R1HYW3_PSEEN|nr:uL22 family ribosomal protein [Pseudonocardia endophytica]TCK26763.1 large subunit ribosomal protein L22 [Pseudonocardia endophytica]
MSSAVVEPSARADPGPSRVYVGRTNQARVDPRQALRVLERVDGMRAPDAVATLRFAAGSVCVEVARVVEQAVARARSTSGVDEDALVVTGFEVGDGEAITRVRRLAHGRADWITTRTTSVRVELTDVRVEREEP